LRVGEGEREGEEECEKERERQTDTVRFGKDKLHKQAGKKKEAGRRAERKTEMERQNGRDLDGDSGMDFDELFTPLRSQISHSPCDTVTQYYCTPTPSSFHSSAKLVNGACEDANFSSITTITTAALALVWKHTL